MKRYIIKKFSALYFFEAQTSVEFHSRADYIHPITNKHALFVNSRPIEYTEKDLFEVKKSRLKYLWYVFILPVNSKHLNYMLVGQANVEVIDRD